MLPPASKRLEELPWRYMTTGNFRSGSTASCLGTKWEQANRVPRLVLILTSRLAALTPLTVKSFGPSCAASYILRGGRMSKFHSAQEYEVSTSLMVH